MTTLFCFFALFLVSFGSFAFMAEAVIRQARRDYFAACAMAQLMPLVHKNQASVGEEIGRAAVAAGAYAMADAMLKARKA